MSIKELASLIGQTITIRDIRTGVCFPATINDVRSNFGKTQLKVETRNEWGEAFITWFEPSASELATVSSDLK